MTATAVWCAAWAGQAAEQPFGVNDVLTVVRPVEPITIVRADEASPILLDGLLDEPIWREAPVISDFVVVEPDTLQKPPHVTRARLFYTSRGLYVGFELGTCGGSTPSRVSMRSA